MVDLPKGRGSEPKKMVKTGTADLPKGRGAASKKEVDPKISKLVVKGKTLSKKVDPSMAKMPK